VPTNLGLTSGAGTCTLRPRFNEHAEAAMHKLVTTPQSARTH
jgi:hypothetical protein